MKNKIKTSITLLAIAAILCSCNNLNNNTKSETTSENEISTSEASAETQESAFIKDGIMYVRDNNGNCYTYNQGIYTDDETNEEYIYGTNIDLYSVAPEEFSDNKEDALEKARQLDDENTSGKGVKILLSKMNFDSAVNRYYFEEDILGQKLYYPENSIWEEYSKDNTGKQYIYSKNGTRIYFNSLEEITE